MFESVLLFLAKVLTILVGIGIMVMPIYLLVTFFRAIYKDIKGEKPTDACR